MYKYPRLGFSYMYVQVYICVYMQVITTFTCMFT